MGKRPNSLLASYFYTSWFVGPHSCFLPDVTWRWAGSRPTPHLHGDDIPSPIEASMNAVTLAPDVPLTNPVNYDRGLIERAHAHTKAPTGRWHSLFRHLLNVSFTSSPPGSVIQLLSAFNQSGSTTSPADVLQRFSINSCRDWTYEQFHLEKFVRVLLEKNQDQKMLVLNSLRPVKERGKVREVPEHCWSAPEQSIEA